jgi:hypothetical protein
MAKRWCPDCKGERGSDGKRLRCSTCNNSGVIIVKGDWWEVVDTRTGIKTKHVWADREKGYFGWSDFA